MMDFYVQAERTKVMISKEVFLLLLGRTPIIDSVLYKKSIIENKVSFTDIKNLATKAGVPYPLFFAPIQIVKKQILDDDKNLSGKYPSKEESVMSPRGSIQKGDIDLIVKNLSQRQEFLKRRIFLSHLDNLYVGSLAKKFRLGISNAEIADNIRTFFLIDLKEFRSSNKSDALNYLCSKIEARNIYISFSSNNYMPQNIKKDSTLSGICIKDKKFPWIFINTRDGDERPLILESGGRQIFTLVSMLVCIGIQLFAFSSKIGRRKSVSRRIFSIAGEILLPRQDLVGLEINNLEQLKYYAQRFKVTPSMLLMRLKELGMTKQKFVETCRELLRKEVENVSQRMRAPLPERAYRKYNGEKFSRDILGALKLKKITPLETKSILFRKGKVDTHMFQQYISKFS